MSIEETVVTEFGKRVTGGRLMTVADATLIYAVTRLQQVQLVPELDEESITAALFGSLSAAFPFCVETIGNDKDVETDCYWSQFKKTKPSNNRPQDHESKSGADFALALRVGDDDLRVALFQAKRGEVSNNALNVHRRVGPPNGNVNSKDWRDAQIVTLVKRGIEIMDLVSPGQVHEIEDLTWIHYLGYYQGAARCIPLSRLRSAFEIDNVAAIVSSNMVNLRVSDPVFTKVLLSAVSQVTPSRKAQWLTMTWDQATKNLPKLLPLTTLYFVDEGRGKGTVGLHGSAIKSETKKAQAKGNARRAEAAAATSTSTAKATVTKKNTI